MKKLLYILAVLVALLCAMPASATITTSTGYPTATTGCGNAATCTASGLTSTVAGTATIVGVIGAQTTSTAISSITAGFCSGTWQFGGAAGATAGDTALGYCTNTAASQTSLVVTMSVTMSSGWQVVVWNGSSSLGTWAIDSGATAIATANPTACATCTGVSLTLSSNNKVVFSVESSTGTSSSCAGTGWTCTVSSGDEYGVAINIATSGAYTAPTSFTQGTSGSMVISSMALQETSSGSTVSPVDKNRKYEKLDETAVNKHYQVTLR